MKVVALLALFGVASTLKLSHKPVHHSLLKTHHKNIKASSLLKLKSHLKQDECLPHKEAKAIGEAIAEMPEDAEVTPEMYEAMAEEHGYEPSEEEMAELEELFHAIDTDGSGSHSKAELEAAWGVYREHCPPPAGGPRGKKLAQMKRNKILLKVKNYATKRGGGPGGEKPEGEGPNPSDYCPTADEQAFLEAEFAELPDDLAVTKEDYVALAEAHDVELTEDEAEVAEEIFEAIDQNGDGAHSKDELEAAYNHFMAEYCS